MVLASICTTATSSSWLVLLTTSRVQTALTTSLLLLRATKAEIDGLNARIKRPPWSAQLIRILQLDAANRQIADLQNQLNDCRNQKPVVKVKEETNRLMESAVTFRQGKSVIDASQMPNVERVAIYLKNHSAATCYYQGLRFSRRSS